MKGFMKVLLITIGLITVAALVALYSYNLVYDPGADRTDPSVPKYQEEKQSETDAPEIKEEISDLEKAFQNDQIVNTLFLGMDGQKSEVLFLSSFDRENKKVTILSIPTNTYFYQTGFESAKERCIGEMFGRQGIIGVTGAVETLFQDMPIHNYVRLDYRAVSQIVDVIGGVEVDIPFDMKYDDTTLGKELHIDLKKGKQLLNGEKALQYLRYKNNNPDAQGNITVGYENKEEGRAKAQQAFLKKMIQKSLSIKLPQVVEAVFRNLKTDITLKELLKYADDAMLISMEDVTILTLPGSSTSHTFDVDFLYHEPNTEEIKKLIYSLYQVKP